jgi:NAD(P)-dependent dehydrogenase (short-subunit alcohol dehydrogenase family)
MDLQLAGKRALVTGSSSGIGAEIARALAREGASVVVHGRDFDRTTAVCEKIRVSGGAAGSACGDLMTNDGADAVFQQATEAFGGIDILVNNAGGADIRPMTSLDDIDVQGWDAAYRLNVLTSLRMIKAAAPQMQQRGWGRLIQISSRSAIAPSPSVAAYAAAKSALNSMTTSFSSTLAGSGVTCNAIMPGPVKLGPATDDGHAGSRKAADVRDVAAAVLYFSSPAAGFINGTTLLIDGGYRPI